MKTRERTVHFYDVTLSSHTQKKGIANASCADLSVLLQAMTALSPGNTKVFDGRAVQVRLADWQRDASSGCYLLLLNRADREVSDVTFRDFTNDNVRNGGKTADEGLEGSSHVVVRPNSDGRTALVLITMGAGVSIGHVCRAFSELTRTLKSNVLYDHLFEFPVPSGERNRNGSPVTYRVGYSYEPTAHKSGLLDQAIKAGKFVSMDLISYAPSKFDAGGNLQIQEETLTIIEGRPGALRGLRTITNALNARVLSNPQQQFDQARVRYKNDHDGVSSTTFAINDLDQAFTRKTVIEFTTDVPSQQTTLNPTVIAGMLALI